jgi:membrane fusion protein (multidrug efflux system)
MRYAVTVLLVLLIVGGLAALKGAQFSALADAGEQAQKQGPQPEAVATARSGQAAWGETIEAVGSVASSKGVTVTGEVPGTVTRIAFESGQMVKKGQVLVELDASIERAELGSASAERDLAALTADRSRQLADRGALAKAGLDQDRTQLQAAQARVEGIRAQLAKKVVRAPFSGRLGIRAVNLGQYLTPGTPIATLESVDEAFVDFTVPQNQLGDIAEGTKVQIKLEQGSEESIEGTVTAIAPSVDESTRSVQLRASVPNQDQVLRPGTFVDVAVMLPKKKQHVIVPATAIMHATYGDSVFVVEDKKKNAPGMRQTPDGRPVRVVRQQFVRTGPRRGDYVAVLAGLRADQEVVVAGGFKLRNGAPVVVSKDAAPQAKLDPTPENR